MSDEELEVYRARPLPPIDKIYVKPLPKDINDLKAMAEFVNMRAVTPDEINIEERRRRSSKNTLGESRISSVTPESKERGIAAVIYSPPAKVSKAEVAERAVGLVEYKSEPAQETWVELTWWQALIHRLRGNKIRVEPKE